MRQHEREYAAIERAKELGTYNKIDRSKQYAGRYSTEVLLHNDNLVFAKNRQLERRTDRQAIMLWILGGTTATLSGITIWLADHLYECLDLSHKLVAHLR